jgi:non-specific serine/threonine protein kinase
MELVEGTSLRQQLPKALAEILSVGRQLCTALEHAHAHDIIHRDLKPENVLLAPDGTVKLADFGLAHTAATRLSGREAIVGTAFYLAPEQVLGEEIDGRADLYALGVVLYELATGQMPFVGDEPLLVISQHLHAPAVAPSTHNPALPPAFDALILRLLNKQAEDRPRSAAEVRKALDDLGQPDISSPAPGSPPTSARKHNLPAQLTPFVGRRTQLAHVLETLTHPKVRLLTLTGPGGTGKTRLALQAARQVLDRFEDGVCFVDLASIRDPGLFASTVGQALGVRGTGGQPLLESLKTALGGKRTLLLLDNFERIIDAAPLVTELLAAAPGLKALVTSREALHVYGERQYPVPPLEVPDLDRMDILPLLSRFEAVELFCERARAVQPDFRLGEDNAAAIAEICVRVDGLPLAIELAAARCRLLSPERMRVRLKSRLGTLVGGSRDLPARMQTLRGAIDWSYDLLDAAEQTLFSRLAVFRGGRTIDAVEAVCGHDLSLDVLDGLESLMNKSLLRQVPGPDGKPRFLMLETIHEYARGRLEESGEAETLQRRHAGHFAALAERAEPELQGGQQGHWYARLRAEHDNLRAALAWLLGGGDTAQGLRLAGMLCEFWSVEGHIAEGMRWMERALESAKDASPDLRVEALNKAGLLAIIYGASREGRAWGSEALALSRQLGDRANSAWALFYLGAHSLANPEEYVAGIALCEEGLTLFRELDEPLGMARTLNILGELARLAGDYERARIAYEECIAIFGRTGDKLRETIVTGNLSYVVQHQGDHRRAEALCKEGIARLQELEIRYPSAFFLAALAGPVAAQGDAVRATRLLGAAEAIREAMGVGQLASDQLEVDAYVSAARAQLSRATFEAAWAAGRAMSLEEAVAYALGQDDV